MEIRIRNILVSMLLSFVALPLTAVTPPWVQTYGGFTRYSKNEYLTGFAREVLTEAVSRDMARDKALADLAGKISTRVQSELVQVNAENGGKASSSVSQITRNSVQITVPGADFEYYQDKTYIYALASVAKTTLVATYAAEASSTWEEIKETRRIAHQAVTDGEMNKALRSLYKILTTFHRMYENYILIRSIQANEEEFFQALEGAESLANLQKAESEVASQISALTNREAKTLSEAVGMIAVILDMQGARGGRIQVPPMLYESTAFSSEFGRYAATRLESELIRTLRPGAEQTIFHCQYWEEGNTLRIIVLASKLDGEKIGRSEILMPRTASDNRSLKPQGFNEAMVALQEFADGAISDGGINIDIWTNKGRNKDALVFLRDEVIQLFFRVNQPAYLQITYRLATGEFVLLEESFYIGSDRVNRTVELPYEFEVVPPFGVENLIVTAYSDNPPTSNTLPKRIDGQLYQVFSSIKDVVSKTRGIARRQKNSMERIRVGEAMLTLTTM